MYLLSGQHLSNMVQLGFMASFHGESEKSALIFSGLQGMNPHCNDIALGLAVARINAGQVHDAIEILQNKVLKESPDHPIAMVFLAWAYRNSGHSEKYEEIRDRVLDGTDDEAIALLMSLQSTDAM